MRFIFRDAGAVPAAVRPWAARRLGQLSMARPASPAGSSPLARPWARLRALLPDAVLLAFALLQLSPFLAAFHQTADDNFWQYAVLSTDGSPAALGEAIRRVAETQGRIGLYPAMPLVLLGAMLPEYAWGRVLVVGLFGALVLAFGHLIARRLGAPLTRASFLLSLCLMPMAAHHMPPNAYPLLITLPLAALVGMHLWIGGREMSRAGMAAAMAGLAALALMLEYNLVAGAGLATLAVLAAGEGRRWDAVRLHAPPLVVAALVYVAYRAAFPSGYAGIVMAAPGLGDVLRLQALHAVNGTGLPFLASRGVVPPGLGRTDLALAAAVLVTGAWLAWRLLPALAAAMPGRVVAWAVLGGAAWAWLNTLPHALTGKYQEWCRMGDCAYVDSRVAALGFGIAAAAVLAALLRVAQGRRRVVAVGCSVACALGVGVLGASGFLGNRAAAREMAARERPFAVLREMACRPEAGLGGLPVVTEMLARSIQWHRPPAAVPPPGVYVAAYRDHLARLGLGCRPVPFAPPTRSVEFLGWSAPDASAPDASKPGLFRRWTDGPGGVLLLAGDAGSRGMVLTLAAYVPRAGGTQRVVARLGDGTACEMRLGAAPVDLAVPWDSGGRAAVLVLETPEAVSPMEVGESEDRRSLGVLLQAARPWLAAGTEDSRGPGLLDLRACSRRMG